MAGNISQVPSYLAGLGKAAVQEQFKQQVDVFVRNDVDFLIGEVSCLPVSFARSPQGRWLQLFVLPVWAVYHLLSIGSRLQNRSLLYFGHVAFVIL